MIKQVESYLFKIKDELSGKCFEVSCLDREEYERVVALFTFLNNNDYELKQIEQIIGSAVAGFRSNF